MAKSLKRFQRVFPNLLKDSTVSLATTMAASLILTSSPVSGLKFVDDVKYNVSVTLSLDEPFACKVQVDRQLSTPEFVSTRSY